MKIWKYIYASGAAFCWLAACPAQAQSVESLPALEEQLAQFLGKSQGEVGGARQAIDGRLRLKKCPQLPEIEKRDEGMAVIRCEPLNWRISIALVKQAASGSSSAKSQVVIKRGQPVLLIVRKDGFLVSRQMEADRNGGLGDIIPVRANRKSPPIMAEIIGEGRVSLPST
ncbi:MAG: flagella basal body P-ring formation protein FlgA [Parasphingorhabdus sp.]|uniref:flagella basal body P-ring formation protein FlgA n=1 Tax=Parasphingorhabdus sp. TaxID=2709688 RepID=UPI0030012EF7